MILQAQRGLSAAFLCALSAAAIVSNAPPPAVLTIFPVNAFGGREKKAQLPPRASQAAAVLILSREKMPAKAY